MKHISEIIEDILTEWAYRTNDGMPNPKNPLHLIHLEESLDALGLSRKVSEKLLNNLREIDFKNKEAFRKYKAKHKMRKTTKVNIGGKETTVGDVEGGDKKINMDTKEINSIELEKPDAPEQNKNLDQDIDYSGENTPEHITAEITPTDDEFEQKKKDGKVKEQKYKNKTIEVNGKTYNQPLSVQYIEYFFPQPPYKFYKKYIKTLQRIINTQRDPKNKSLPAITEFVDGVGAGEIPAQAAELLTLMTASMSDE